MSKNNRTKKSSAVAKAMADKSAGEPKGAWVQHHAGNRPSPSLNHGWREPEKIKTGTRQLYSYNTKCRICQMTNCTFPRVASRSFGGENDGRRMLARGARNAR
jgi:hypothetical protein